MVSDVSTVKTMKNIYISNPEYYMSHGTKFKGEENIVDQRKIVRYLHSGTNDNDDSNDLATLAKQVNANEDNFSFFVSDAGHTNGYRNAYFDKPGGHGIVNQLLKFKEKLKERHMYDNSYILVVSDHGRPPSKNLKPPA